MSIKYSIKILTRAEEIECIRQVWESYEAADEYKAGASQMDRFLTEIRCSGGAIRPYVIMINDRDGGSSLLVGKIEYRDLLCNIAYKKFATFKIKYLTIIYGGLLGKDWGDKGKAVCDIFREILSRGEVDAVFMNQLHIENRLQDILKSQFCCFRRAWFIKPLIHWRTSIGKSFEAYKKNISRKCVAEVRRYRKKLNNACNNNVRTCCYTGLEDCEYLVKIAAGITKMSYKNSINAGFHDEAVTRSLMRLEAKSGDLRAYILYGGDRAIAFEYGYIYKGIYFMEHMGYDPDYSAYSPGTILFFSALERIYGDGDIHFIDYGFGDAQYKRKYADIFWQEKAVHIFRLGFKAMWALAFFNLCNFIAFVLDGAVTKTGLRAKLKSSWRRALARRSAKLAKKNRAA
jgi:hypothetical protein